MGIFMQAFTKTFLETDSFGRNVLIGIVLCGLFILDTWVGVLVANMFFDGNFFWHFLTILFTMAVLAIIQAFFYHLIAAWLRQKLGAY